jgi:hypothetical protein
MAPLTLPCSNPIVTCANCAAPLEGCRCAGMHMRYTVPVCGGCCAVGGEPDKSAWERVEEDTDAP